MYINKDECEILEHDVESGMIFCSSGTSVNPDYQLLIHKPTGKILLALTFNGTDYHLSGWDPSFPKDRK